MELWWAGEVFRVCAKGCRILSVLLFSFSFFLEGDHVGSDPSCYCGKSHRWVQHASIKMPCQGKVTCAEEDLEMMSKVGLGFLLGFRKTLQSTYSFCASMMISVESEGDAVEGGAPVSSRKDLAAIVDSR